MVPPWLHYFWQVEVEIFYKSDSDAYNVRATVSAPDVEATVTSGEVRAETAGGETETKN